MHLTRSLDTFLDIAGLHSLDLGKSERQLEGFCRWTPAALGFLGAAQKRVMRMQKVARRVILLWY